MSFWKTTTTMRMIDESRRVEQVEERDEVRPLGDARRRADDAEARAHLHRARPAQDEQRAVDDVGDDEDVDDVGERPTRAPPREEVKEALEHGLGLLPALGEARRARSRACRGRAHVVDADDARRRPGAACSAAAMEAPMRSAGGASRSTTARNDLRLAPTATGTPARARTSSRVRREELEAVPRVLREAEPGVHHERVARQPRDRRALGRRASHSRSTSSHHVAVGVVRVLAEAAHRRPACRGRA